MTGVQDLNSIAIAEFRENSGWIGGNYEGTPMLLLHTIGAKSGAERVNPVMYRPVDGGLAVFASNTGAETHPDWYHNLLAQPDVQIEIGTQTVPVHARVAEGVEREQIWQAHAQEYPPFAEHQSKISRLIPIVVLEPVS
ncbi:MAG: nitroreductase family deazaflavin-dependent oxidoreductase [Jatrophihabitantaceae bacterium]